jgi:hypothetical protein
MQGLRVAVDRRRDRRGGHGQSINGVCFRTGADLHWALAVASLRHSGGFADAIIAVGLVVAAANRAENPGAEPRLSGAGAGHVEEAAGAGPELTELAGRALQAEKAAAGLAGNDRLRAAGD